VNEKWLKTHHVPSWRGALGVSSEITDKTDKELLKILHSLPVLKSTSMKPRSITQHLQLLGYIWKNKSSSKEEDYLQVCIHNLILSNTRAELTRTLGWMVKSSISTILQLNIKKEHHKPYLLRASLEVGELLLPFEYYLEPKKNHDDIWKAYEQFINICSVELGLPFLRKAIDAESDLVSILNASSADSSQTKRGSSLKSWAPDFEWDSFMEGLDLDSRWKERIWLIGLPDLMKRILRWVGSSDEELVISLLSMHIIRMAAPYLRPTIREAYFKLYGTAIKGIITEPPRELRMLSDIQEILPDVLCILYSRGHRDKSTLANIRNLTSHLRNSAVELMSETDQFSKVTRSKIKEKLHRIKFELGKTSSIQVPDITYNPESLFHTILSVHNARNKQLTLFTGKPASSIVSTYPCFITNASYFEESNHIVIPWGILQWPFYHNDAPLGWNHGGIGATICHEMVHAFDLEGSKYSPRGTYKEIWTRRDKRKFKSQTRKLSRFFSKFKHIGKMVDGERTLSENWADLGGLKIALHSLNKILEEKSQEIKKEAHRNFFISYAVSWRELYSKKSLDYSMQTSVHALSEDRVDRIVPQFKEWVQAFDIKETDALFMKEEKRLQFF
jgi:putative endopeptidase